MARRSYEALVRDKAKELGFEISLEPSGPYDTLVEMYGHNANRWIEEPHLHTVFRNTEDYGTMPQVWKQLLADLDDTGVCAEDCNCRS